MLLPRLAAGGVEVRLLTLKGRGAFFEEISRAGIPAACAELRGRFDVRGLGRSLRLAGEAPDVVVSQGVDALVAGRLVALRARAPHVVVEHHQVGYPRRLHRRLLTRLVGRGASAVVAVSPAQLPDLRRFGYRPDRLTVIRNGVEESVPARPRSSVRAELGVRDDEFVAVFVAGLKHPKRPSAFVAAVARAGCRGLVVGDGPLREEVAEAVAGAGGAVVAVGERADVPDLLGAADVACLVSDAEALPLVLLEAMSAGLPTVASDVGGVAEAVVDGETGLLVPPRDDDALATCLVRLRTDPARARTLGEAGRARWEARFSAARMADEYAALLERVGAR